MLQYEKLSGKHGSNKYILVRITFINLSISRAFIILYKIVFEQRKSQIRCVKCQLSVSGFLLVECSGILNRHLIGHLVLNIPTHTQKTTTPTKKHMHTHNFINRTAMCRESPALIFISFHCHLLTYIYLKTPYNYYFFMPERIKLFYKACLNKEQIGQYDQEEGTLT